MPAILLEGDEPAAPGPSGPGEKFAAGAPGSSQATTSKEPALPETYGTGLLSLTPRDPHCLCAHWDVTAEQQRHFLGLSAHRQLAVRIYRGSVTGQPASEVQVHPESRHWFLQVERGGQLYAAELGYHRPDGKWATIATSKAVATPHDTISQDTTVRFGTIHFEKAESEAGRGTSAQAPVQSGQAVMPAGSQGAAQEPPRTLSLEPRPAMGPDLSAGIEVRQPMSPPIPEAGVPPDTLLPGDLAASSEIDLWSLVSDEVMAELTGLTLPPAQPQRAVNLPSAEAPPTAEGTRVKAAQAVSSPAGAQWGEISSPLGGELVAQGFWLNVNAELVIYGSTEPAARVTIDGRPLELRPDGSFSYRLALPDGDYALSIAAVAPSGDTRRAELKFHRGTTCLGEVGAHPQDPALCAPSAETGR